MESSPPAPPSASPMLSVADWDARIDALKQRVLAGDWSAALLRETADAQESREAAVEAEAEAARDAAHPFRVIGNTVRVPFGAGTRRAMICDVNGDGTLDVIFEASSGVPAAEATVPADTATRLERFETEDARAGEKDDEAKANRLKEEANALFKLKDSIAAGERYKLALATLKRAFADVSVGAGVLLSSGGRCRAGTVMGVDDGGAGAALDVMYDLEPRALLRELGGGDDADADGGGDEDEEEEELEPDEAPHLFRAASRRRGESVSDDAFRGRVREAFKRMDRNGDGDISRIDLIKALKDPDNDDLREMLSLPERIRQEDGTKDRFEIMFQAIDKDESKKIHLAEWERFFFQALEAEREREREAAAAAAAPPVSPSPASAAATPATPSSPAGASPASSPAASPRSDRARVAAAREAWEAAKSRWRGSYAYCVDHENAGGFGYRTELTVRDGRVAARAYRFWKDATTRAEQMRRAEEAHSPASASAGRGGARAEPWDWVERGEDVGTAHGFGHAARTLDELYDEAERIAARPLASEYEKRRVGVDESTGLLTLCVVSDARISGEDGVRVSEVRGLEDGLGAE